MGLSESKPSGGKAAAASGGNVCMQYGLPSSKHHLVIGRGGSTVKDVQRKHKVNVTVNGDDSVTVEGVKGDVERARKDLEEVTGVDLAAEPICVFDLNVPEHKYGAVIGARGSNIREIEEKSRVVVEVPQKHQHGKHVRLLGTRAGCGVGKKLIENVVGMDLSATVKTQGGWEVASVISYDLTKQIKPRVLLFPERKEPEGCGTLQILLRYLNSAKRTIDICVFTITNDDITSAILTAHRRGVTVRLITDNAQSSVTGSDIPQYLRAGIPVRTDAKPEHMHHKFAVLDSRVVLNGSFNWTVQAQLTNNENIVVSGDSTVAAAFTGEFESLWKAFKGNAA